MYYFVDIPLSVKTRVWTHNWNTISRMKFDVHICLCVFLCVDPDNYVTKSKLQEREPYYASHCESSGDAHSIFLRTFGGVSDIAEPASLSAGLQLWLIAWRGVPHAVEGFQDHASLKHDGINFWTGIWPSCPQFDSVVEVDRLDRAMFTVFMGEYQVQKVIFSKIEKCLA